MATYDVVILTEQPMTTIDVENALALHEAVADPVHYHILLPIDEASARVETAMASLSGPGLLDAPLPLLDPEAIQEIEDEFIAAARRGVTESQMLFAHAGADAVAELVTIDPLDALVQKVAAVQAAEVIVLTRPHVVAEFFHQDWTSRARKKLGVPVLHLIEHERFDEQAGQGEGITGM